jgi:hypothetical protein
VEVEEGIEVLALNGFICSRGCQLCLPLEDSEGELTGVEDG